MKRYLCKAPCGGRRVDKDGNWVTRLEAEERIAELQSHLRNARQNVLFLQEVCNKKQKIIDGFTYEKDEKS